MRERRRPVRTGAAVRLAALLVHGTGRSQLPIPPTPPSRRSGRQLSARHGRAELRWRRAPGRPQLAARSRGGVLVAARSPPRGWMAQGALDAARPGVGVARSLATHDDLPRARRGAAPIAPGAKPARWRDAHRLASLMVRRGKRRVPRGRPYGRRWPATRGRDRKCLPRRGAFAARAGQPALAAKQSRPLRLRPDEAAAASPRSSRSFPRRLESGSRPTPPHGSLGRSGFVCSAVRPRPTPGWPALRALCLGSRRPARAAAIADRRSHRRAARLVAPVSRIALANTVAARRLRPIEKRGATAGRAPRRAAATCVSADARWSEHRRR